MRCYRLLRNHPGNSNWSRKGVIFMAVATMVLADLAVGSLIWWLVVGLIAGVLAGFVMRGGFGLVGDIIAGIVGAFIGGLGLFFVCIFVGGGFVWGIIFCFLGGGFLVFLFLSFFSRLPPPPAPTPPYLH